MAGRHSTRIKAAGRRLAERMDRRSINRQLSNLSLEGAIADESDELYTVGTVIARREISVRRQKVNKTDADADPKP